MFRIPGTPRGRAWIASACKALTGGAVASLGAATCLAAADPHFSVTGFRIEGIAQSEAEPLEAVLQSYLGPDRTIGDLQAARVALESALRSRGYDLVAVQLPPQTFVRGGEIVLRVVRYRVGRVRIEGALHHDEANIRRSLPALSDGAVPDMRALDAQLQLANDAPVKRTTVVIMPGMEQSVDFDLRINDVRPWRIATGLDNTGTEETGELRFGIGFQHANLWNRDHVFSFHYVTAPYQDDDPDQLALPVEDDVRIFGASYRIPLPRARAALELYGGSANVDSGVVAGAFDITGSGSVLGGRVAYVLPAVAALEQRLTAGYEARTYDNDVAATGGSEQLVPDYRVNPLSIGYSGQARFGRTAASAHVAVAHNIPTGADSSQAAFDAVRAGASNEYLLARFAAQAQVSLDSFGDLELRLDGQYTDDLLVPGEQFGIGGINSVRGLEERQFIADRGASASFEWLLPNPFERSPPWGTRLLLFVDGAYGQTLDPTSFELSSIDVASAGAGLRVGNGRSLALSLDYGHLIDPDPALDVPSGHWHGSFTWFF